MVRISLFIALFIAPIIVGKVAAQDSLFITKRDTTSVSIVKDSRIDLLIKKQIQVNEETSRNARRQEKGFRLLVISTTLRDEANSP